MAHAMQFLSASNQVVVGSTSGVAARSRSFLPVDDAESSDLQDGFLSLAQLGPAIRAGHHVEAPRPSVSAPDARTWIKVKNRTHPAMIRVMDALGWTTWSSS